MKRKRALGALIIATGLSCAGGDVVAPDGVFGTAYTLTIVNRFDDSLAAGQIAIEFKEDGLVSSDRMKIFSVDVTDLYRQVGDRLEKAEPGDFTPGAIVRIWPVTGDRSSALRAQAAVLMK